MSRIDRHGVKVYINVYDLHPNNHYVDCIGFGAYHTGIELNGREYTFGSHAEYSTGVFDHEPRGANGAVFRQQLFAGVTPLSSNEISRVLDKLRAHYLGIKYDMLTKNCNHFSESLCQSLGVDYPGYLNRLASFGQCFRCCLPGWIQRGAPVTDDATTRPREISQPSSVYARSTATGQVEPISANSFQFSQSKGYSLLDTADAERSVSAAERSQVSTHSGNLGKISSFFGTSENRAAAASIDEKAKREKMREAHVKKLGNSTAATNKKAGEQYQQLNDNEEQTGP